MYRALYRKFRPATFSDVVGQGSIVCALQNQLLHQKVGHAYLFTGTRGTGKTTCAKIFAKAVNCPQRNGADPCCTCSICTGIDDGSVMDVVEIDAASNNGVDNIRDLRDETAYTPSAGSYKVYIIDEVHMLSTAAFNALLKIMEEPPSHVIFILATTEIHKVPATILSRCQRYDFTRIKPEDITGRLLYVAQEEKINLMPDAAALIARLADGAMRDALSILDTCAGVSSEVDVETVRRMAGVTDKSYLFELSSAVSAQDAPQALALVAQLREKSIDIKRLCDELILHYRNLLLAAVPGGQNLLTGTSAEDETRYLSAAQSTGEKSAVFAIRTLANALDKMGKGTDPRIELELALFTLCQPQQTAAPALAGISPAAAAPVYTPPPIVPQPAVQTVPLGAPPQAQPDNVVPPPAAAPSVSVAQSPAPETVGQAQAQPFAQWSEVLQNMEQKDGLLYVNMKNSKAYYEGRRVLIDGSDLFMEYMRKNEYSSALIKQTIAEVTGTQYAIGPYKKKAEPAQITQNNTEQTLQQLSEQGVKVVYDDESKE